MIRDNLIKILLRSKNNRFKIVQNHINHEVLIYLPPPSSSPRLSRKAMENILESISPPWRKGLHIRRLRWYQCRFKKQQFVEIRGLHNKVIEQGYRPTNKLDTRKPPQGRI